MPDCTLSELLACIEESGGPDGLDLAGRDLSGLDAGPEALQAALEAGGTANPPWRWAETGGLNLAGADLARANLTGARLPGASLEDARLEGAILAGADLAGAHLNDANLEGADLQGASLADARLDDANLEGANLAQADLQRARLDDANLQRANLKAARLRGASLRDANLEGANLRGTRLAGADLTDANLQGVDLSEGNLEGAVLRDACLEEARLRGARLCGANLEDADLEGADLRDADLTGANLRDAGLEGTDLGQRAEARAGEPLSLSLPLEGASGLSLSVNRGTIRLTAEERDDILLRSEQTAAGDLQVERLAGVIYVRQPAAARSWGAGRRLDLELALPRAIERLEVKTGLGSIHGRGIAAEVSLATGKGDIRMEEGCLQGELSTGLGDLVVWNARGDCCLRSGVGQVTVENAVGARLQVSTGRGDIRLQGGQLQELDARSGAGSIRCACQLAPGHYHLGTGAGEVHLELAGDQAAQIDAATGMGRIHSDWPLVQVGRPGPAALGSARRVGSIGPEGERATVVIKSGLGNVYVKRSVAPASSARLEGSPATEAVPDSRLAVLESLARGEITVDEAVELIGHLGGEA